MESELEDGTAVAFMATAVPSSKQNSECLTKPIPHFKQKVEF
jgi:hypothetical protein